MENQRDMYILPYNSCGCDNIDCTYVGLCLDSLRHEVFCGHTGRCRALQPTSPEQDAAPTW